MKTKILLAVATAVIIGAASLFATGDAKPFGSGAPPAAEMSCHAKSPAAPAHGCCMGSGHAADHGTGHADASAGSCHKK